MQDTCGDFGHSGQAGGFHQALVHGLQLGLGLFEGRDVARNAEGADEISVPVPPRHFGDEHPFARIGLIFGFADDGFASAQDVLFLLEGCARE